ncbi:MAG: 6-hydroxymethylpterin diphosphokinase MptE-like protein [Spirochaetota bacterium]
MEPELRLEQTPHGTQVYYRGRALYGPNPEADAGRRAGATTIPPDTLVLWLSPLVWHGWRELAAAAAGSTRIVAIEADPILFELASRTRPTELGGRFALVRATASEVLAELRRDGEHRFRRVVEITTSGASLAHRTTYRSVRDLARREIRVFWQNRLTLSAMGRLWIRNLVENIPLLRQTRALPSLAGPVLVCGAGPSLEAALPAIAAHRDQLRVLAVDTAVPILDAVGIRPDVVLALEGQLLNAYDFLPVSRRDYLLVTDLTSDPTTARAHDRRSMTLTGFAPVRLLDRAAVLPGVCTTMPALGSVGVAAFNLATLLGARPIILSGLDFAVLPGATHARGAPAFLNAFARTDRFHRPVDPALSARMIRLPGARATVASTLVLKGYADELASLVADQDDVFALDPIGLNVGAIPLAASDLGALLERGSGSGHPRKEARRGDVEHAAGGDRKEQLVGFVRREIGLLDSIDLSDTAGIDELPPELDYLASEIPERIESLSAGVRLARLDRSARARLRVTAAYYRDRWNATLERLTR